MPYLLIENFKLGIDLRRSPLAAEPGSLRVLLNAFINAGGEIEKRKNLTSLGSLPPGLTHGLGFYGLGFRRAALLVFGTAPEEKVRPLPVNVEYQRLNIKDAGLTIAAITDVQNWGEKAYVVARLSDDSIRHFLDGEQVEEGVGTYVRAHKKKLYSVNGPNLNFSGVAEPGKWKEGTGAGVIDVSHEDAVSTQLIGLAPYYSYLAVLAQTFVQVWAMDPDPKRNTLIQTLGNIGLVAPHAAASYGNGDVLFLSDTGVRSIRARDSSRAAVINDIGSPVDAWVKKKRNNLTPEQAQNIRALIDPLTGHFWLIWGSEVLVLAVYPHTKIAAWSVFDLGRPMDDVVVAGSRIVLRQGDEVFVYGAIPLQGNPFGAPGPVGEQSFDGARVEALTPFLDAKSPAAEKTWQGIDITCTGEWKVEVNPDPNSDEWTLVGTINHSTWGHGQIPLDMRGTHISVRLRSSDNKPASLSALALHFEGGEET